MFAILAGLMLLVAIEGNELPMWLRLILGILSITWIVTSILTVWSPKRPIPR
ncbi:MAG TPA: hypothetical protein VMJ72_01470 [Candidatus Paceibacterota bacterium]|nr:hypothetical protein [Candidatus Paceibacterota bacterium]